MTNWSLVLGRWGFTSMPTYEYECDACGHKFEKFQSITAAPIKKCPVCGKSKVRRLIGTGAGLIFKGSGFYITDYRDSSYKDKAKSESGEAKSETKSESSTGGEAKGETKAEAKPAAKESKPAAKKESKPSKKKD
jgi:putative FmdB family regulatory protein